MKHLKNLGKVLLGIYLCFSLIANAAAPVAVDPASSPQVSVTKDELAAQKELLQIQIDSKKELLQKDIESQGRRIDAVDKRIDDQANRVGGSVDRFAVIAGQLGIVVTVLLVFLGFLGYGKAKSDATETARSVSESIAKNAVEKWIEKNKNTFDKQRQELDTKLNDAIHQIDLHVQNVKDSSEKFNTELQSIQKILNETKPDQLAAVSAVSDTGTSEIKQRADELKHRPEDSYSFDDWNTRAFASFKDGKIEDAVFYWGRAAEIPAAGAVKTVQAIFNKGISLGQLNRIEEAINVYDELILKFHGATESEIHKQIAKATFNKGCMLGQLHRYEEAITVNDLLIQEFWNAPELELRELLAKAMVNKSTSLLQLNRYQETITVSDELIQKFCESSEAELHDQIIKAMFTKGLALSRINRIEDTITLYDELNKKFGGTLNTSIRVQVFQALMSKGVALVQVNRIQDAITVYDELSEKLRESIDSTELVLAAQVILNKCIALTRLNLNEEALILYDELIKKFNFALEPKLRKQIAQAMLNKGILLSNLNRKEEAIATYDTLINNFGESQEADIEILIAHALNGKGFFLLCEAKSMWEQQEHSKKLLQEAQLLFNQSIKKNLDYGLSRGNLAYVAWLMDELAIAEQEFRKGLLAKNYGQETLYEGTLSDFKIAPIEPDKGFKILVEKLWAEYQQNQKPTEQS